MSFKKKEADHKQYQEDIYTVMSDYDKTYSWLFSIFSNLYSKEL